MALRQRLMAVSRDFVFAAPLNSLEALKTSILRMADGVVEVELGSEVPFTVICMLSPYIVCMEGEQAWLGDMREARESRRCMVKSN